MKEDNTYPITMVEEGLRLLKEWRILEPDKNRRDDFPSSPQASPDWQDADAG